MHKILSIREKIPQISSLPDGMYNGSWSGEWRMSAKDVLDVIIDLQNGA